MELPTFGAYATPTNQNKRKKYSLYSLSSIFFLLCETLYKNKYSFSMHAVFSLSSHCVSFFIQCVQGSVFFLWFSSLLVEPCWNRAATSHIKMSPCCCFFYSFLDIANKWFVCYFALRSYHFINVWVHRLNYIDRHELFMLLYMFGGINNFIFIIFFSFVSCFYSGEKYSNSISLLSYTKAGRMLVSKQIRREYSDICTTRKTWLSTWKHWIQWRIQAMKSLLRNDPQKNSNCD